MPMCPALQPWQQGFLIEPPRFNRPNVTLVDTAGRGVGKLTAHGAVVAGHEIALDCMIYATGFDFMTEYGKETDITITGRGGVTLGKHWHDGARTLFGMQTHGFPNLLLVNMVLAGISQNYTHVAGEQAQHIAWIISQCLTRGISAVDVSPAAEAEWVDEVIALSAKRRGFLESCTPGYYNYEGIRDKSFGTNEVYGGGPMPYFERLHAWREAGDMPGLNTMVGAET
jgi:cyclohexanone monooxygenase